MNKQYVVMEDIIGDLAHEYGIPILPFEELIKLGHRVVQVYKLEDKARKITFDMLCEYIKMFLGTPFGSNTLKELRATV